MPKLTRSHPEVQAAIFNHDYPIVGIQKYQGGLKVIRKSTTVRGKQQGGRRQKVKELSQASLKRLAFLVTTSPITFKSLITLTYSQAQPTTMISSKEHLNTFLLEMKRQFGSFAYVWFLEFQKRGAPHYHILVDLLPPTEEQRMDMALIWHSAQKDLLYLEGSFTRSQRLDNSNKLISVHSHAKAWEPIKKVDGAKFYVIKYASKKEQKLVPEKYQDVGRFWGSSRNVPAKDFHEVEASEEELRAYLVSKGLSVANQHILPKLIIDLK